MLTASAVRAEENQKSRTHPKIKKFPLPVLVDRDGKRRSISWVGGGRGGLSADGALKLPVLFQPREQPGVAETVFS